MCDVINSLAIPLVVGDPLIGVNTAEDRDALRFGEWYKAYLEIVANQIALVLDHIIDRCNEPETAGPAVGPWMAATRSARSRPACRAHTASLATNTTTRSSSTTST